MFLPFFWACTVTEEKSTSENDIDAARNFIRAALNGNYDEAKNYLLPDSVNTEFFNAFQRNYKSRMSREDKKGYRESSITIHSVTPVNDSTTVVQYSNSYKKKTDSLKVMKVNEQWLVDFKYSFQTPDSSVK